MKRWKRLAALLVALAACILLSACGGQDVSEDMESTDVTPAATDQESSKAEEAQQVEHSVTLTPELKSVAVSESYVAVLWDDGTVHVGFPPWELNDVHYTWEPAQMEQMEQAVSSWSDVIQIVAQNNLGGQDLFALKRDGTLLYTNLDSRDTYESTFSQWKDVSNLSRGSHDEMIGLTADGQIYYTDSQAACGTVLTLDKGFAAAIASHNGHLYGFYEDGQFGAVLLEDGSYVPYDREEQEQFLEQMYGEYYADYKKVQSSATIQELANIPEETNHNFKIMSTIMAVIENYKKIASIPDLRLKTLAEFTEFPFMDMILTQDGKVSVIATTWNVKSASDDTPEEFDGNDFVQIAFDENVGAALRKDGTVAVFTGKDSEGEEDYFLEARDWTDIVTIYAENDVLLGITLDGRLRVADGDWFRRTLLEDLEEREDLIDEGIEALGWTHLYVGN